MKKAEIQRWDFRSARLDRATGLTNARLKGARLIFPGYGDDGPTLEIFTYDELIDTGSTMANHLGFTHIAFEVDDVPKTYEAALKHGGQSMGQVTEKEVPDIGRHPGLCLFQGSGRKYHRDSVLENKSP